MTTFTLYEAHGGLCKSTYKAGDYTNLRAAKNAAYRMPAENNGWYSMVWIEKENVEVWSRPQGAGVDPNSWKRNTDFVW